MTSKHEAQAETSCVSEPEHRLCRYMPEGQRVLHLWQLRSSVRLQGARLYSSCGQNSVQRSHWRVGVQDFTNVPALQLLLQIWHVLTSNVLIPVHTSPGASTYLEGQSACVMQLAQPSSYRKPLALQMGSGANVLYLPPEQNWVLRVHAVHWLRRRKQGSDTSEKVASKTKTKKEKPSKVHHVIVCAIAAEAALSDSSRGDSCSSDSSFWTG